MKRNNDIKNYLRGVRKGGAANRLEREALSDPFLYEALEGLTSTPGDPIDGLIRLERQLNERGRGARKKNRSWLYVAASFLVLAMCGILWGVWVQDESHALEQELAVADTRRLPAEDSKSILSMGDVSPEGMRDANLPGGADSSRAGVSRKRQVEQAETEVLLSNDTGREDAPRMRMSGAVLASTVKGVADTTVSPVDIDRFNRHMAVALKYPEVDVEKGNEGVILASFELNKGNMPSRIRIKEGFSKESNKELIRLLLESPKWESSLSGKRIYVSVRFTIGKNGAKHTAVLVREKSWE